jgi:hypothetical protein
MSLWMIDGVEKGVAKAWPKSGVVQIQLTL